MTTKSSRNASETPSTLVRSPAPSPTRTRQSQLELFSPEDIGYAARLFAQCSLPHTQPPHNELEVTNGNLVVTLMAPEDPGLPFGLYARKILAYLVTIAVRSRSPEIPLGKSFSAFASRLQILPSTGPNGNLPRLRDQLLRILGMTVLARWDERRSSSVASNRQLQTVAYTIASKALLWWDAEKTGIHDHAVVLSTDFFRDILEAPIPFDLGALLSLRSTLAQDLYVFLTYRAVRSQRLGRSESIPLEQLRIQLNCTYQEPRNFRRDLVRRLQEVLAVYPAARVSVTSKALVLGNYRPHIAQLPK